MATPTETRATLAKRAARRRERFLAAMAGAILLTILLDFGRISYFRAFTDAPRLRPIVHVHAIVFTGWVPCFFAQTMLVHTGRADPAHLRDGSGS
jgi:hypothetical protein